MPVTKMDALGRVQLPIGIRYKLDLNYGDKLAIDYLGDDTIILKKIDLQIPVKAMENLQISAEATGNIGDNCSDILDFRHEGTRA